MSAPVRVATVEDGHQGLRVTLLHAEPWEGVLLLGRALADLVGTLRCRASEHTTTSRVPYAPGRRRKVVAALRAAGVTVIGGAA